MTSTKAWRFLTTPPGTYEPGWRLTPRWAMRVLRSYVIAGLCSGLLFVICTGVLALFFPGTPAIATTSFNVFGYVDLAQILSAFAAIVGLSIVGYRSVNAHKLTGQKILVSTVVPTAILFATLTVAQWQTQETFTLPEGLKVQTNRIDVHLCASIKVLRCSFPRVNCDQFGRYPDGTWQSSPSGTLIYPDQPGSFGNVRFAPHTIAISGPNGLIDLTDLLDRRCRYESKLLVPSR
jgi:MFS family permease